MNSVQKKGGSLLRKSYIRREDIIKVGREIVSQKGINNINIRLMAEECNVSVGSIYNYFSNKDELLIGIVESIWREIFSKFNRYNLEDRFSNIVKIFFECINEENNKYPMFFSVHFAGMNREAGKSAMNKYFTEINMRFKIALVSDSNIKPDVFNDILTQDKFIEFVLTNVFDLVSKNKKNCDTLLYIIDRILYN